MTIDNRYVTIPDQTNKMETTRVTQGVVNVDRQVLAIADPETAANFLRISASGTISLPTGAATESTLDEINTKLGGTLTTASANAIVISNSSSSTTLTAGSTFTGTSTDVLQYGDITLACLTDKDGTLYAEFSNDGTNWDSSLNYSVKANVNESHRLTRTRRYFRARFTNTSATDQTFFRLQCIAGEMNITTSRLNSEVQTDADTVVVRPMDFNLMVAQGLYQNNNVTIKDGLNIDIDTASVPEDLDNVGGVYAGFPSAAAAAEIVVSGTDTGTVWYSYMASDTDTDYTFASKAITGAGTYSLGHNIWRCNYAYFNGSAINVGNITIRHTATPTTIFCQIDAGVGQTYCAAYTVPYNSKIYLDRITGNVRGSTSGSLEGFFYYKPYGQSPYLRFPFELQFGTLYFDDVDFLIEIPSRTDIVPRITSASVNNLSAKVSYRFVKVKA